MGKTESRPFDEAEVERIQHLDEDGNGPCSILMGFDLSLFFLVTRI